MAMTEEEKQKLKSDFLQENKPEADEYDPKNDPWTDEAIIAVAHKILKRMGLDDKYL